MTRAERHAQITALLNDGHASREIAGILGVSYSFVRDIISDPDRAKTIRRRQRYGRPCVDCGRQTDGSLGRHLAPERCQPCRYAYQRTLRHWTHERIIERIREWADIHGEPPAAQDWNPALADNLGDHLAAMQFRGANGHWPSSNSVCSRFGTWNNAIRAAGCEPRRPGQHGTRRWVAA